jgi:hypothetical protein
MVQILILGKSHSMISFTNVCNFNSNELTENQTRMISFKAISLRH